MNLHQRVFRGLATRPWLVEVEVALPSAEDQLAPLAVWLTGTESDVDVDSSLGVATFLNIKRQD